MQTILGSGGSIGNHLVVSLSNYTNKIRLVSRQPKQVSGAEELFPANLLMRDQVMNAVKGSDIAYLTVGLKYSARTWARQWPVVMQNVIDACKTHQTKLVFFDNVYMYGKVNGWMMEETPFNPCSKKGEVRAKIAMMILDEVSKGNLNALIARSADLYGPDTANSILNRMVLNRLYKGEKALLMAEGKFMHAYTYTPDAARALAILGNTPSAYLQTWHMPTDHRAVSGIKLVKIAAGETIWKPKYKILTNSQIRMAGIFNPFMRESLEMLYQYKSDYLFSSGKFDKAFPSFTKTTYLDGIELYMNSCLE